ncbi:energy-coupling factor ABC transporter ATP-binding protein [Desulfobulbus rhabdoformis]|uniref:ABC transporter ATP-binding protein n=1 Tax=Desulfobulbus rhabdoformis TaxID=34032 RepID=UPI0019663572|nr:ABC transporter ATP-binding protein [Desulfobulbus rhabdoformis]MBM9613066.1 energy-coupling factor ABC transporter ATP-binding protein [Desulfobulbus rhabdoformis]
MHHMAVRPPVDDERTTLFSLRQLAYTYPDGTPGLRSIDLDIFPGDRVALVGQNGSGKSTLIRHLNGLFLAQAGRCSYQGELITEAMVQGLRQKVGILFQDPDDHLFCNTLYDDVAFGPRNQGRRPEEVERLVHHWLGEVELDQVMYKPAHHLSYGQKKRAALAAILAMEPEVLILDEPTANLDPRQEAVFRRLLEQFTGALIAIDHDLLFLYGLCERAVVLAQGQVHHDYSFQQLAAEPQALCEHGLDFTFRFTCCGQHYHHDQYHHHHHGTHEHEVAGAHLHGESQQTDPIIELQHYWYSYPDTTPGVSNINLSLFPGDTLALIGENGAGKSTLAHCLLGLHRPEKNEGFYLLEGRPLARQDYRQLWRRVGMVFQNAADQLFSPSCREEVAFGPEQLGLSKTEVRRRVEQALELVGLSGYAKRPPLHMSGGERKRLAIAATLSLEPEVLILDEPTASLDPRSEELLLQILADLPITKILVTHDLFFVRQLCARTVVLHQGRIIRDYATHEFLADEHLQVVNGLDYTYKNSCYQEIQALQGISLR